MAGDQKGLVLALPYSTLEATLTKKRKVASIETKSLKATLTSKALIYDLANVQLPSINTSKQKTSKRKSSTTCKVKLLLWKLR